MLALGNTAEEALAVLGDYAADVPVFVGPGDMLAELTGYILHRGLIASMHRPELPSADSLVQDALTRGATLLTGGAPRGERRRQHYDDHISRPLVVEFSGGPAARGIPSDPPHHA